MLTVRSILCPVDFSEQSRQAPLWASAIAQYRGAHRVPEVVGRACSGTASVGYAARPYVGANRSV
jgi:hypothetical protein